MIVLARKPLSERSIAANVLRWGTGALNIDASRIDTNGEAITVPQSDPAKRRGVVGAALWNGEDDRERFQQAQRESARRTQTLGRWPANVLLAHTVFCQQIGTREVQSGVRVLRKDHTDTSEFGWGSKAAGPDSSYGDEHGVETIPAWDCVEDCPIRLLDAQSGERAPSAGTRLTRRRSSDGRRCYSRRRTRLPRRGRCLALYCGSQLWRGRSGAQDSRLFATRRRRTPRSGAPV